MDGLYRGPTFRDISRLSLFIALWAISTERRQISRAFSMSGVYQDESNERQAFPKHLCCPELSPMPGETVAVASNSSMVFASDNAKGDPFRSSN